MAAFFFSEINYVRILVSGINCQRDSALRTQPLGDRMQQCLVLLVAIKILSLHIIQDLQGYCFSKTTLIIYI